MWITRFSDQFDINFQKRLQKVLKLDEQDFVVTFAKINAMMEVSRIKNFLSKYKRPHNGGSFYHKTQLLQTRQNYDGLQADMMWDAKTAESACKHALERLWVFSSGRKFYIRVVPDHELRNTLLNIKQCMLYRRWKVNDELTKSIQVAETDLHWHEVGVRKTSTHGM